MCPLSPADNTGSGMPLVPGIRTGRLAHVVVSYDITDDGRRSRLAKTLAAYLGRVQFSVFEGEVADTDLPRLLEQAVALLDLRVDSLRVYHLCKACVGRSTFFGVAPTWPSPDEDEVL